MCLLANASPLWDPESTWETGKWRDACAHPASPATLVVGKAPVHAFWDAPLHSYGTPINDPCTNQLTSQEPGFSDQDDLDRGGLLGGRATTADQVSASSVHFSVLEFACHVCSSQSSLLTVVDSLDIKLEFHKLSAPTSSTQMLYGIIALGCKTWASHRQHTK